MAVLVGMARMWRSGTVPQRARAIMAAWTVIARGGGGRMEERGTRRLPGSSGQLRLRRKHCCGSICVTVASRGYGSNARFQ